MFVENVVPSIAIMKPTLHCQSLEANDREYNIPSPITLSDPAVTNRRHDPPTRIEKGEAKVRWSRVGRPMDDTLRKAQGHSGEDICGQRQRSEGRFA